MENKRTYIRRKRCLSEITATIKNALQFISERNNNEMSDEMIDQLAQQHSSAIEAACWFPKQHMTESEYANLLMGKAKLLCQALISSKVPLANSKTIPAISSTHNCIITTATPPPLPKAIPKLPTPIPKISTPVPQSTLVMPTFSEPEVNDKPMITEKNKFCACLPMSSIELRNYLEKGIFSFGSMSANSIPPLIDRGAKNKLL